jgi:NADPH:quinone reductase-like Zn-dependent oxidoreductase
MAAMKAVQHDRYGGPEVVVIREVETPVPTEDLVLVKVHAASVNRADLDALHARYWFARVFTGIRGPRDPGLGLDVAGVVEAVGPEVTAFKPGDRVFGDMFSFRTGSFAEYVCARERAFGTVPEGMDLEVAATLPHSAILALQGLRLRDGRTVEAGHRVLVDGASGNVGPFAVQIAKAMGAEVTGTCRTEKVEFVRSTGADHVLDYTSTDYTTTGKQYDWILDTDSHQPLRAARRALRPGGAYVTLGGSGARIFSALLLGRFVARAGQYMGLLIWWRPFQGAPEDVARLLELVESGKVRPFISRRYPLDQAADALRWVDEGRSRGKVLITVD